MNVTHFFVILAVVCIIPSLSERMQRKAAAVFALAAFFDVVWKHI